MSELTREQAVEYLEGLVQDKVTGHVVARLLNHDAALRARVKELEKERDDWKNAANNYKNAANNYKAAYKTSSAKWGEAVGQRDTFHDEVRVLKQREARLREALEHCLRVFRSMSDRGSYPRELLPLGEDGKTEPLFMGKQGFRFIMQALQQEATGEI